MFKVGLSPEYCIKCVVPKGRLNGKARCIYHLYGQSNDLFIRNDGLDNMTWSVVCDKTYRSKLTRGRRAEYVKRECIVIHQTDYREPMLTRLVGSTRLLRQSHVFGMLLLLIFSPTHYSIVATKMDELGKQNCLCEEHTSIYCEVFQVYFWMHNNNDKHCELRNT